MKGHNDVGKISFLLLHLCQLGSLLWHKRCDILNNWCYLHDGLNVTLSQRTFFHKRKLYNPTDYNPAVAVCALFPQSSRICLVKPVYWLYTSNTYQIKSDEMLYPSEQTSLPGMLRKAHKLIHIENLVENSEIHWKLIKGGILYLEAMQLHLFHV